MIVFQNPGMLDPRLITTLGVNVKDTANGSPFGHFGTGLKYAIAVLLREKQRIEIWNGDGEAYSFRTTKEELRGKEFEFISMLTKVSDWVGEQKLGFTTELGKNWTIENAYRELHCNCRDEGGIGGIEIEETYMGPNSVVIVVYGEEFHQVHLGRDKFLLSPSRIKVCEDLGIEVYAGGSDQIFYKGVAVCKLSTRSENLYNFTNPIALTEDRTAKHETWLHGDIAALLISSEKVPAFTFDSLAHAGSFEQMMLDFSYRDFGKRGKELAFAMLRSNPLNMNKSLVSRLIETSEPDDQVRYTKFQVDEGQAAKLKAAVEFCCGIGFEVTRYEIEPVLDLGENVLAKADRKLSTIFLTRRVLDMSENEISATLIEEFVHLNWGVGDETRMMQDRLFREIVRLGGIIRGKVKAEAEAPDEIPF